MDEKKAGEKILTKLANISQKEIEIYIGKDKGGKKGAKSGL